MKIAIHHKKTGFSASWIDYCNKNKINYKVVNCYSNTIIQDLGDCDALMWHFHQTHEKDVLFAKQLIYSLQCAGKVVFPDIQTCWHFDDKVGQKYLLESVDAPLVPSYVFYDKINALKWVKNTTFPKVFKLRTGSGSSQVRLIENRGEAKKVIKKAFGKGFRQYEPKSNLKERWRKFTSNKSNIFDVLKGVIRLGYTTEHDRVAGTENGYVYFQDFIEGNNYDNRVIVIDGKACAIKRINRKNDFRASGSGNLQYEKGNFSDQMIRQSFEVARKINSKCLAIDYVFDDGKPLFVELSYGFPVGSFVDDCIGYWDEDINWHQHKFNVTDWMVQWVVKKILSGKNSEMVTNT